MNLLRVLVRPALAAPFITDGIDAVARPRRHMEKLEKVTPTLERAGVPPLLTSDARLLTRVSGAVSVLAGLGLATGRAPRTSAAVLAALNIPLTLVNYPVWTAADKESRKRSVSGLLRGAAVGGGLLLAAVDRQGRPSLAWRVRNSRQQREAIEAAHLAVRERYGVAPA
ncbi:DoxX family membrane protein [Actinomyces wuliandei]|uniref:DoxX family membrane protein n=1 Tax=Actinomyces wuliandei TaxID=2057743 RepID=UPI00111B62B8|nr:DoxX family membrane protein [Actinomyces wuliandei]